MEKKQYQSPRTKVVEVQQRQVLCVSNVFDVKDNGNISKGEWDDDADLGW